MGNVSSRPDDGAALYLRDQTRLSIASLIISNSRTRASIHITPNAFPCTRVLASRPAGDTSPIEFIQDPEAANNGIPNFILKLSNEDELMFTFTFHVRQAFPSTGDLNSAALDTQINGLTYVYASTPREVENLVTREFHADPNLHKNANVELIGDFSTGGSPTVTFDWSWKWKPPKHSEDPGGGWRSSCSFVQYDQRAHQLQTLASFSFWVQNALPQTPLPSSPPPFHLTVPPRTRGASSQSLESRVGGVDLLDEPVSPPAIATEFKNGLSPAAPNTLFVPVPQETVKVDVSCPRPADDVSVTDDGPVFRATMKALEQKTGNMRTQMKRMIKKAEAAYNAQQEANDAAVAFIDALKEASSTNANAVQPAIEHYFDKIAREILSYERQNTFNLHKIVIEPLSKVYTMDIKQAEAKKRDFEEESKDFYAYVGRYLGQRQDSIKAKHSDNKYQTKRRNFELKRFDYSSFMQDLSGGRKEQEILSHLTRYADAQARIFLETAKKVENLLPQLAALSSEVQVADKEYQYQRREREEKRRLLEKSNLNYGEPDAAPSSTISMPTANGNNGTTGETDIGRADSTGSQLRSMAIINSTTASSTGGDLSRSPGSLGHAMLTSPSQAAKFKGIRDLEERDAALADLADRESQRKEGLLWALNRPGGHVDPRNLNKQGWHKFWIVLDQGKLSEYSNWKQKLDLHMEPIDLRMASVREARNAERRFCFEVITPHFKRVYQATSEDDMNNWITAINNALQSAVEGRVRVQPAVSNSPATDSGGFRRDIGSILTGKSPSLGHAQAHPPSLIPGRRTTVGARPSSQRAPSSSYDESPDKLLQALRDNDQGNCWCADCGSGSKVEWVSINLAIILCIECSGIHRSLGTHISKVRSLTLDITSFTPDIVELLLLVGNRISNMVWESRLDPTMKPGPQATREQRLKFITAKYVDRAFVEPISSTLSRYPSPDETLLAAIKKNEIQQVIYALALRANPNVQDKSRGTHAVFLALAATDPASPSPATSPAPQDSKQVPFPIAEMLLQNGAELPTGMPAFPLSRSAQLYLEQKRGRSNASSSLSPSVNNSNNSTSMDTVGSLPSTMSPLAAMNRDKEKDGRLAKRASAGGRLAKSPIPER